MWVFLPACRRMLDEYALGYLGIHISQDAMLSASHQANMNARTYACKAN